MVDKVSSYQISFSADAGNLSQFLDSLKTTFRSAVADIQSTTAKLNAFANLQADLQKSISAFVAARAAAADFAAQIATIQAAGGNVGAELTDGLAKAERAATSATKSYVAYSNQIAKLDAQLKAAGVDTSQLATEQLRLADSLKAASLAAANQASKDLLGFTTVGDITPKINALNAAFNQLRTTGKLSADEIAAAETQLATKIAAVRAEVTDLGATFTQTQASKDLLGFKTLDDVQPKIVALRQAFDQLKASGTLSAVEIQAAEKQLGVQIAAVKSEVTNLGTGLKATVTGAKDGFLAVTGAITGVFASFAAFGLITSKIKEAVDAAREFNAAVTQIGTISNLSSEQLNALGNDVRALARSIGTDVVDATKQLYAIIRSGISSDNSIAVLAASADAAKISQTSLGDATKLSTTLVQQFGVQVDDVERVLSIFVQSARNGGATLSELSSSLAAIAPIARATNTPIEDIAAALQVMVKAGVPAEAAVSDLTKILTRLNTETARKQLSDLGITTTGLVTTLQQIGQKNIDLDGLLQLGLTSQKSATAIQALTSNSKQLTTALAAQKTATADAAAALKLIDQTPAERLELLKAASHDLEITFGNVVGATAKYSVAAATLVNRFNNLSIGTRTLIADTGDFRLIIGALVSGLNLGTDALADFTAAATKLGVALGNSVVGIKAQIDSQIAAIAASITQARGALQGFSDDLQKTITASQASTAAQIADLNARAAAQIAALDQSTAAEKATADATLAIQIQLAADRLKVINDGAAVVLKAASDQAAALLKIAQQSGKDQGAAVQAGTQLQLDSLSKVRAQYQAHYDSLLAQEKGFIDKINSIDATRVSFQRDIEQQITEVRNEGLSGFDQYLGKVNQIKALLADAEKAFAAGGQKGLELGLQYTKDAESLTRTLGTVVTDEGQVLVSSFDLQQQKLELLTKARDQGIAAIDREKNAAVDGANATVSALNAVKPLLDDLTEKYDALNAKVQAGLDIKVKIDEQGITDASKAIDDGLAQKEHLLAVKVDVEAVQAQVDGLVANLKKGITEGVDAQLDGIKTSLAKIADEAPELKLDPTKANAQIEDIRAAVAKIAEINPKVTVDSNVPAVQAQIDNLKKPTESTHTVHIKIDGQLPGGDSGSPGGGVEDPGSAPALARGGYIGAQMVAAARSGQRAATSWRNYAHGGSVFARPGWSKVPGSGNTDSVPAALQSGSFVVRKSASRHYGDAIMKTLSAPERFRIGGIVQRILGGGPSTGTSIADRILTGGLPALPGGGTGDLGGNLGTAPDPELRKAIIQADSVLLPLAQEASLLPQQIGEQNLGEYFNAVLRLIEGAPTAAAAHALLDPLLAALDAFKSMIAYARENHLPIVSGVLGNAPGAGQDPFGNTIGKELGGDMPAAASGDTVPAMLMPGEYVVQRSRVNQLGTGFLHALNNMQVDRDMLSNMLSPQPPQVSRHRSVAHFAEGGLVGGSPGSSRTADQGKSSGGDTITHVTIQASAADIFTESNVRRLFLPVFNKIIARSR